MSYTTGDRALNDLMTLLALRVLRPEGQRIYDLIMEEAGGLTDYFDAAHGGGAYTLWMRVTDLLDDPRGPQSEELLNVVACRIATAWLAIDQSSSQAVDDFFERWHRLA